MNSSENSLPKEIFKSSYKVKYTAQRMYQTIKLIFNF